jgi:RimJ/RimL family protein N-acetyltransferase
MGPRKIGARGARINENGSMPVIAKTPRLLIRSWVPEDAPALLAIYSDPLVTEYIPHVHLKDLPAAEAKVREMTEMETKHGFTLWAVEEKTSLVGVCGFRAGEFELGFAFARSSWGKGFASEAAQACLRWGEEHGMLRAVAQTRPENVASRRVLDRLGFVDTGARSPDGIWCIYERLTAAGAL